MKANMLKCAASVFALLTVLHLTLYAETFSERWERERHERELADRIKEDIKREREKQEFFEQGQQRMREHEQQQQQNNSTPTPEYQGSSQFTNPKLREYFGASASTINPDLAREIDRRITAAGRIVSFYDLWCEERAQQQRDEKANESFRPIGQTRKPSVSTNRPKGGLGFGSGEFENKTLEQAILQITNEFESRRNDEALASCRQAVPSGDVKCTERIAAYDLNRPSRLVGYFEPQSVLVIEGCVDAARMLRVVSKTGDGKEVRALCKLEDLKSVEVVKWFRKLAEQGIAKAQWDLGSIYELGWCVTKDSAEAVKWYRKAAEQGHAAAQYDLGVMYAKGEGVTKDSAEAMKWVRKAAEQGYPEAQCDLGGFYYNGEGVTKDSLEAMKWVRKAAEQGIARAQRGLGWMYAGGEGVTKDSAEAVKWYRKAAEQGDADAQGHLGLAYAEGDGVAKDEIEALAWLNIAAAWLPEAKNQRDLLEQRLGKEVSLLAQQRSKEILRKIETNKVQAATLQATPSAR